jgi:hypothetical protein
MHTIPHTIVKISSLFFFAVLLWGCKKEGFTRLMDVEMKIKIVPDTERIRLGDTVKIIAWLPYKQYDRATNSAVDIRGMEVQSWGAISFQGLDSIGTDRVVFKQGSYLYEDFFYVSHPYGSFSEYPKNHIIGNMHQNDTAFYFELRLIARKPWVFKIRPTGGRGFMENGRFRIDIANMVINSNYHQHLSRKYMPTITPYQRDYFFEIY